MMWLHLRLLSYEEGRLKSPLHLPSYEEGQLSPFFGLHLSPFFGILSG